MKPERRYRESVHKHLPVGVYAQGMGGTQTRGTPDAYYEGVSSRVLWVEWKWTTSLNPRLIPEPEPLQQRWLRRAHSNGVQVAVICGCPKRGYVFPGLSWESRLITDAALAGSKQEVAIWIAKQVR